MAWHDISGNLSDITSAICNTLTLAATFYIAIKANDFLKSKIRDEGFKRGAEILDEIDSLYDSILLINARYSSLKRDYEMAFGDKNYNNLSGESVLKSYDNVLNEVTRLKKSVKHIQILLLRLHRWGIVIKHEFMINDVLSSANIFLQSIHAVTEHALSVYWPFMEDYLETTYQESLDAEASYDKQHKEFEDKYKLLLGYKLEDFFES
ncbi:hypothetical protein RM151_11565 [Pantoea agglomerans]|uniref:hypothetical protein n=1 Tax=Enterobacter agglomerans TaxID=549 RepID=UPI00289A18BC|nr:hypothetical protein [Pantoea agglomerans]WNK56735.1 hypothetical protein RM151_11565 [Pantoea agglomerans]